MLSEFVFIKSLISPPPSSSISPAGGGDWAEESDGDDDAEYLELFLEYFELLSLFISMEKDTARFCRFRAYSLSNFACSSKY